MPRPVDRSSALSTPRSSVTAARLTLLVALAAPGCSDDASPADDETGSTGDDSGGATMTGMTLTGPPMTTTPMETGDDSSTSDGMMDTTAAVDSSTTGGDTTSTTDDTSTGADTGSGSGSESGTSTGGAMCGDGTAEGSEDCDGDDLADATCETLGRGTGDLVCADDCTFDTTGCTGPAICGNGVREGDEACDGADFGGQSCADFGSVFGNLACDDACAIDSTACSNSAVVCATPGTAIGPDASQFVESLDVVGTGFVTDVDVFIDATHSYVGDLDVQIRHVGAAVSQYLLQDQCGTSADVVATFDQDAADVPDCVEPTAVEGTVLPFGNLDAFVGTPVATTWELEVADDAGGDGGALAEWCVSVTGAVDSPVTCGDGVAQFGEVCDGDDVAGTGCVDLDFGGGTLACNATCDDFDASACDPASPGDTCGEAFLVDPTALPYSDSGDTLAFLNHYGYSSGVCPGETGSGNNANSDVVYELTPETSGVYTIELDAGFDSTVYMVTDCSDIDGTCVGGADNGNPETIVADLVAGTTYFIIGGAWSNTTPGLGGAYTLTVSAPCIPAVCDGISCGDDGCGGTCGCDPGEFCDAGMCAVAPQGDTCVDPFIVGALPYSDSSDTLLFNNDYGYESGACPGEAGGWNSGAEDVVYAFTPAVDGNYTIDFDATFDSTVYVVTDCADVNGTCIGAADNGNPETVTADLVGGTTYFIIGGHYSNVTPGSGGAYTLNVSQN